MASLGSLKRSALKSTRLRHHRMHWNAPRHGERNSLQDAECTRCGDWVQIQTSPMPNGIDIGGPAVAIDCRCVAAS